MHAYFLILHTVKNHFRLFKTNRSVNALKSNTNFIMFNLTFAKKRVLYRAVSRDLAYISDHQSGFNTCEQLQSLRGEKKRINLGCVCVCVCRSGFETLIPLISLMCMWNVRNTATPTWSTFAPLAWLSNKTKQKQQSRFNTHLCVREHFSLQPGNPMAPPHQSSYGSCHGHLEKQHMHTTNLATTTT